MQTYVLEEAHTFKEEKEDLDVCMYNYVHTYVCMNVYLCIRATQVYLVSAGDD